MAAGATITEEIRDAAGWIEERKPELTGFFYNTINDLAKLAELDGDMVRAVEQLTLATEQVYVDTSTLLPLALGRRELPGLASLLAALVSLRPVGAGFARTLLRFYPGLQGPVHVLAEGILSLARGCAESLAEIHRHQGRLYRPRRGVSSPPAEAGGTGAESAGRPRPEHILSFCLSTGSQERSLFLLQRFSLIAVHAFSIALEVQRFNDLLEQVRWPLFRRWLERGVDLLTSGHLEQAAQFLRGHSRESRFILGVRNVVLEDVKGPLRVYCASITGISVGIAGTDSSSFNIPGPYTDGRTIFLPPVVRYFEQPRYNERVYTVLAAMQSQTIHRGTYDFTLAELPFSQELADRYGTLLPEILPNVRKQYAGLATAVREPSVGVIEAAFPSGKTLLCLETDLEKFFYSFPAPDLAKELFTLVENARLETALLMRYPGFGEDLDLLNRYLWQRRPALAPSPRADRLASCRRTLEELIRLCLTRLHDSTALRPGENIATPGSPPGSSIAEVLFLQLLRVTHEHATVQTTAAVVFDIYTILHQSYQLLAFVNEYDVRSIFEDMHKQLFFPEIIREVSPELLRESPARVEYDDLEKPIEEEVDLTSFSPRDARAEELRRAVASGELTAFSYPEFNAFRGSYESSYCTIFERCLPATDTGYYDAVIRSYETVYKRIRKRFLMLRPDDVEISRRWLSGDDVHLGDAVDYSIDLMRGVSPDEKIYFRKMENKRDITVAILVDSSSSTDESVGRRRIIDIEKAAISLLASALSLTGDSFAMFGFFSMGRRKVFLNIVKDFDEPWNQETRARIPALEAYAANRDGCAIRHATARLLHRPERTKLLLLLSDGMPADLGYGAASAAEVNHYAIEDTRRAVMEARLQGVIPYCLTIDRFARRYIPRLYGEYGYTMLTRVELLPEKLSRLYLKLTR